VLATGESGKEGCVLSEQDEEKSRLESAESRGGLLAQAQRLPEFLREVQQETKLVDRPTWQQVRSTTLVVLVFVVLLALYLHAWDWLFSSLDRWLFGQ
jgi:preprotein translocase SecE subunit